jgi:hypothetical protein
MSTYSYCIFMYFQLASWHSSATLTEVFPCFFLSCKENARVKPANTGHGTHSSRIFVLFCVLFCVNVFCTVLYCTVLYCTVLYCTVLYCTVLYCTVLYRTVMYCTVLYCTVLCCTVLYYCHRVSTQLHFPSSLFCNYQVVIQNVWNYFLVSQEVASGGSQCKVRFCGRWLAGIAGSNPAGGITASVVSFVCWQ